ncbi:MAG TPA: hypothetical protein VF806_10175 [Anaerolineaceae bacterium]
MRAFLSSWSKWVWVLVLLLGSLLALGVALLPTVLQQELEVVEMLRTPAALYIISLLNLVLIIGVLISLVVERFERPMVILFVAFRIGATTWEYELGRHSDWYLAISILLYLLIGGAVLVFLSGHIQRRDTRRSLQENDEKEKN